jgi:16S rRNA (cytidine1402-2'-O)-methyltransferase
VGKLIVAVQPVGNALPITLRLRQCLPQVSLVVASDQSRARRLLDDLGLATPLTTPDDVETSLDALEAGDVALFLDGWRPGPAGASQTLIRAAIARGITVSPVPGPTVPVSALVTSGLPADSFIYLGEFPEPALAAPLLGAVAHERRTLVFLTSPRRLPEFVERLGDRPTALVSSSERGLESKRWAALREAVTSLSDALTPERCVLVIGGASEERDAWKADQLKAEIQNLLQEGLPAKEIGRLLARESGWPRRTIYRLAVDAMSESASD